MDLAAGAAKDGLPAPKLIFAAVPGGIASGPKSRGIPLEDLERIAPATLIVTMVGDKDSRAAEAASRRLLREASAVPAERKLFVRALSTITASRPDGDPRRPGRHRCRLRCGAIKMPPEPKDAPKPPPFRWSAEMALTGEQQTLVSQINLARADALDYLGFWKTFDLAAAAAFSGGDATALKANPRLADMERWSDGWPVKRLFVEIPKPTKPPAVANGADSGRR